MNALLVRGFLTPLQITLEAPSWSDCGREAFCSPVSAPDAHSSRSPRNPSVRPAFFRSSYRTPRNDREHHGRPSRHRRQRARPPARAAAGRSTAAQSMHLEQKRRPTADRSGVSAQRVAATTGSTSHGPQAPYAAHNPIQPTKYRPTSPSVDGDQRTAAMEPAKCLNPAWPRAHCATRVREAADDPTSCTAVACDVQYSLGRAEEVGLQQP